MKHKTAHRWLDLQINHYPLLPAQLVLFMLAYSKKIIKPQYFPQKTSLTIASTHVDDRLLSMRLGRWHYSNTMTFSLSPKIAPLITESSSLILVTYCNNKTVRHGLCFQRSECFQHFKCLLLIILRSTFQILSSSHSPAHSEFTLLSFLSLKDFLIANMFRPFEQRFSIPYWKTQD